jgi:hypothetical protein
MTEADRCLKPGGLLILLEPYNPWFYRLEEFVSLILSPFWAFAKNIHLALVDEKETLSFFFKNREFFENFPRKVGYKMIRDQRFPHQWIQVAQKPKS